MFSLPRKVRAYSPHKSVYYAARGLLGSFGREPNLTIQLLVGVTSIALSVYFDQVGFVWLHLVFLALVISLELVNTAFENLCDLVHPDHSDLVKSIKDSAAGAVLFAALCWLVVIGVEITLIIV